MKQLGKYNNLGCIPARGVDNLHSIDGIMVKHVHNDILKKNVKQSTIKMECHMFVCSNRKTIENTLLS